MRKDITVDAAASGATDQIGGARVLVMLHEGNYAFASGKEDGTDLRFIADDNKTELPFYVEKYDALLNEAHVWVKPEELKPGGKHIMLIGLAQPLNPGDSFEVTINFDNGESMTMTVPVVEMTMTMPMGATQGGDMDMAAPMQHGDAGQAMATPTP